MRIFLDDEREAPRFNRWGEPISWDYVCRTADEAEILIRTGKVQYISFDHDLGTEKTGYDVAKLIEQLAALHAIPSIDYDIHSGNIVGSANIDRAMKRAWIF